MNRLAGKRAIVTGSAGEVARAIHELFQQEGARLYLTDINLEGIRPRAEALGGEARGVFYGAADLARPEEVGRLVEDAVARLGGVEVLVNNAGINIPRDLLEISAEDWDRVLGVNLKGPYFMLQAVARHMLASGKGGAIINVASVTGRIPRPSQLAYGASKAALIYLTRTAAVGLGPQGIRVNAVAPAAIDTPMFRAVAPTAGAAEGMTAEEWLASWSKRLPLGRLTTTRDVSQAILFLASDDAAFISGQTLGVSGGLVID